LQIRLRTGGFHGAQDNGLPHQWPAFCPFLGRRAMGSGPGWEEVAGYSII
jgi:hypothetical protein